jgi:hypothetical protein
MINNIIYNDINGGAMYMNINSETDKLVSYAPNLANIQTQDHINKILQYLSTISINQTLSFKKYDISLDNNKKKIIAVETQVERFKVNNLAQLLIAMLLSFNIINENQYNMQRIFITITGIDLTKLAILRKILLLFARLPRNEGEYIFSIPKSASDIIKDLLIYDAKLGFIFEYAKENGYNTNVDFNNSVFELIEYLIKIQLIVFIRKASQSKLESTDLLTPMVQSVNNILKSHFEVLELKLSSGKEDREAKKEGDEVEEGDEEKDEEKEEEAELEKAGVEAENYEPNEFGKFLLAYEYEGGSDKSKLNSFTIDKIIIKYNATNPSKKLIKDEDKWTAESLFVFLFKNTNLNENDRIKIYNKPFFKRSIENQKVIDDIESELEKQKQLNSKYLILNKINNKYFSKYLKYKLKYLKIFII